MGEKILKGIRGGKLIVVEGPDGSGKTTIIKGVVKRLVEADYDTVTFRDPGSTKLCERLRELILYNSIDPKTELFMFEAAKMDNMVNNIIPALQMDKIVIMDRFVTSTFVYQGNFAGNSKEFIKSLHTYMGIDGLFERTNALSILVTAEPEILYNRCRKRDHEHNKYDSLQYTQYKTLIDAYYENFKDIDNSYIVDSSKLNEAESIDRVYFAIINQLLNDEKDSKRILKFE